MSGLRSAPYKKGVNWKDGRVTSYDLLNLIKDVDWWIKEVVELSVGLVKSGFAQKRKRSYRKVLSKACMVKRWFCEKHVLWKESFMKRKLNEKSVYQKY